MGDSAGYQDCWLDFHRFCDEHSKSSWIFRGVADAQSHKLLPTIGRKYRNQIRYTPARELGAFNTFKRRLYLHGQGNLNDWQILALGQHHGLPTRLLDWSKNPLAAAFFATSSFPAHTDAKVYSIEQSSLDQIDETISPFEIAADVAFVPPMLSPRISSQKGLFVAFADPRSPMELSARHDRKHCFSIPAEARPYFLRRLYNMGVDASSLMADLDGECATIKWKFENGVALGSTGY